MMRVMVEEKLNSDQ